MALTMRIKRTLAGEEARRTFSHSVPHPTQTPSSPSHAVSHSEQRTASRGTPHAWPHHLNPHGPANASFVATAAARRHSGRRVHINTASIPFVPQARYVQHATRCKSRSLCLHDRIPTAPTGHQRSERIHAHERHVGPSERQPHDTHHNASRMIPTTASYPSSTNVRTVSSTAAALSRRERIRAAG